MHSRRTSSTSPRSKIWWAQAATAQGFTLSPSNHPWQSFRIVLFSVGISPRLYPLWPPSKRGNSCIPQIKSNLYLGTWTMEWSRCQSPGHLQCIRIPTTCPKCWCQMRPSINATSTPSMKALRSSMKGTNSHTWSQQYSWLTTNIKECRLRLKTTKWRFNNKYYSLWMSHLNLWAYHRWGDREIH